MWGLGVVVGVGSRFRLVQPRFRQQPVMQVEWEWWSHSVRVGGEGLEGAGQGWLVGK